MLHTCPSPGVSNLRLFKPPVVVLFGGKYRPFLGIIFGLTEVFGPDGGFAAIAGFRIVTNGHLAV